MELEQNQLGESQENLNGLFACGEAACWDMHGFNRLGKTLFLKQLLQVWLLVTILLICLANDVTILTSTVQKFLDKQDAYLKEILSYNGNEDIFRIKNRMQT